MNSYSGKQDIYSCPPWCFLLTFDKGKCTESDWTVQRDSVKFVFSPESVKKMFRRVHQQKGWFLLSVTGLFFFFSLSLSPRETVSLGDRRISLSTLLTLLRMIDGEV